ncbi:hypothetical protein HDU67_005682, partial [Dinochytrium kinnereticum]
VTLQKLETPLTLTLTLPTPTPTPPPTKTTALDALNASLREMTETSPGVRELSTQAFVSWVRYYGEHFASSIFSLRRVNVESLARSFGVVRMPFLRELEGVDFKTFVGK